MESGGECEGVEGEAAEISTDAAVLVGQAALGKRRAAETEPLTAQQLALLLKLGGPLNYPLGKGTRTANGGWTGLGKLAEFMYSDGRPRDGTQLKRVFNRIVQTPLEHPMPSSHKQQE